MGARCGEMWMDGWPDGYSIDKSSPLLVIPAKAEIQLFVSSVARMKRSGIQEDNADPLASIPAPPAAKSHPATPAQIKPQEAAAGSATR